MNAKWNGLSMVRQIRPTSSEFWHGWSDLMLTKQRSPTPTRSSALHGASCPGALGSGGGGGGWGSKMPPPLPCKALAREGDGGGAPPSINHPAGQERPSDGGCMNAGSDDDEALGIWSARNRPCMGGGCQAPARPAANIRGPEKLNALDHFFFGGVAVQARSDFVILFQTRPMSYLLIQICR